MKTEIYIPGEQMTVEALLEVLKVLDPDPDHCVYFPTEEAAGCCYSSMSGVVGARYVATLPHIGVVISEHQYTEKNKWFLKPVLEEEE